MTMQERRVEAQITAQTESRPDNHSPPSHQHLIHTLSTDVTELKLKIRLLVAPDWYLSSCVYLHIRSRNKQPIGCKICENILIEFGSLEWNCIRIKRVGLCRLTIRFHMYVNVIKKLFWMRPAHLCIHYQCDRVVRSH